MHVCQFYLHPNFAHGNLQHGRLRSAIPRWQEIVYTNTTPLSPPETFPMPAPESVLAALRKFDTPTICNVLELFDAFPRTDGYMDARIEPCFPHLPPMVGYAVTATFRSGAKPRGGDVYAGLEKQVRMIAETPGPKVVV